MSRKEESEPLNKKVPKTKGKFVKGMTIIGKKEDAKCVTVRLHKSTIDFWK